MLYRGRFVLAARETCRIGDAQTVRRVRCLGAGQFGGGRLVQFPGRCKLEEKRAITMHSKFVIRAAAFIAMSATAISSPAGAQTIADEVRCVLLSNALTAGSKDAHARQVGASVGSYFMGRLDTRPSAQVKAALAAQNKQMASSQAVSTMNACAARATRAEAQLRMLAK